MFLEIENVVTTEPCTGIGNNNHEVIIIEGLYKAEHDCWESHNDHLHAWPAKGYRLEGPKG